MEEFDVDALLNATRESNAKYLEEKIKEFGILPLSEEYSPVMAAPMEDVEANAEKFIMTECLPACRELWKKNIYTFMVSDSQNDEAWIEIFFDQLSEENKAYVLSLEEQGIHLFGYHEGTISFGVGCFGEKAQQKLLEIARGFKMQDVSKDIAYLDLETALFRAGCRKKVKNPDYVKLEMPTSDDIEEQMKYYDWVARGGEDLEYMDVFDPDKVKKPIETNFEGTDFVFVPEEERVYLSAYHYKKHLNYLSYLEKLNQSHSIGL